MNLAKFLYTIKIRIKGPYRRIRRDMHKKSIIYIIIVAVVFLAGIAYVFWNSYNDNNIISINATSSSVAVQSDTTYDTITQTATMCVYVCGAVKQPGVYYISEGMRVYDAIEAALGATEDANLSVLNLADHIVDGQKIYVPHVGENVTFSDSTDGRININTADVAELMKLTGIGESRAQDIVNYRKKNGAFVKIEDIMKVPGIKDAAFEKIRDKICT